MSGPSMASPVFHGDAPVTARASEAVEFQQDRTVAQVSVRNFILRPGGDGIKQVGNCTHEELVEMAGEAAIQAMIEANVSGGVSYIPSGGPVSNAGYGS